MLLNIPKFSQKMWSFEVHKIFFFAENAQWNEKTVFRRTNQTAWFFCSEHESSFTFSLFWNNLFKLLLWKTISRIPASSHRGLLVVFLWSFQVSQFLADFEQFLTWISDALQRLFYFCHQQFSKWKSFVYFGFCGVYYVSKVVSRAHLEAVVLMNVSGAH